MEPFWTDGKATLYQGDCLAVLRELPSESVHCCVTSPPYWNLRDYGHEGQLGLEKTPAEYVAKLVAILGEVRRVLRGDGTLWLNLGDSYNSQGTNMPNQAGLHKSSCQQMQGKRISALAPGLKPKDLVGIPWRVAFALQADGWYLRQDIIWHKPNPMPESVTDRCTKAHEYVFLLSKSERYFYDGEAIKEASVDPESHEGRRKRHTESITQHDSGYDGHRTRAGLLALDGQTYPTRNRRSVWTVTTKPYPGAHFATFPPDLIEPCIMAGTSAEGCCATCGETYRRVVEKSKGEPDSFNGSSFNRGKTHDARAHLSAVGNGERTVSSTTVGWKVSCKCESEVVPCVVLDPFAGSGTTLQVARENGCQSIGIELNPEYCGLVVDRLRQRVLI